MTVIALMFPTAGILNRYVADVLRPLFGQGAWLLAVLLLQFRQACLRPCKRLLRLRLLRLVLAQLR